MKGIKKIKRSDKRTITEVMILAPKFMSTTKATSTINMTEN